MLAQYRAKFPHVERTMEDLKNKLSKLKSESKDCLTEAKKSKKLTGGGKSPNEPNATQQKILNLCEEIPGFTGMMGETESSAEKSVYKDVEESMLDDYDGE